MSGADLPVPVLDRFAKSWPKHEVEPAIAYKPLAAALVESHDTDAHTAAYSVPSTLRRLGTHRVFERLAPLGVLMVLAIFDVDDVEAKRLKVAAREEWWAAERPKLDRLLVDHPNAYAYRTRGGYRFLYSIDPIEVRSRTDAKRWAARYDEWLSYLSKRYQITADSACSDWTRLYRLPRVVRDGQREERETLGDARAIGRWDPPVIVPDVAEVPEPSSEPLAFGDEPLELVEDARARLLRHGPAREYSPEGGNNHTRIAWGILTNDYALCDQTARSLMREYNATCEPPWDEDELFSDSGPAREDQSWNGARGEARREWEMAADTLQLLGPVDESPAAAKIEPIAVPDPVDVLAILGSISCEKAVAAKPLAESGSDLELYQQALLDVQNALSAPRSGAEVKLLFESATELLRRKFPPTIWLAKGLVLRGGTGMIGGEPKTFKTWLALETCMAVATGTPVAGEFATSAPELAAYFFAEDVGHSIQSRIRALAVGRGMNPDDAARNLYAQPRGKFIDLTRAEDVALMVASCRKIERDTGRKLAVLALDPLRDLHSGEEDKSDDMGPVMRNVRVIGELLGGMTVLVVHHTGKPSESKGKKRGGNRLRGSGAIFGAIDTGIYLGNLQGDGSTVFTNAVETDVKSARAAGAFKLTLTVEDDADDTAVRATWLADVPSKRPASSATAKTQDQLDEDAVLEYLRKLRDSGALPPAPTNLRAAVPSSTNKSETVPDRRVKAALGRLQTRTPPAVRLEPSHHPKTHQRLNGERIHLAAPEPAPVFATLDDIARGES